MSQLISIKNYKEITVLVYSPWTVLVAALKQYLYQLPVHLLVDNHTPVTGQVPQDAVCPDIDIFLCHPLNIPQHVDPNKIEGFVIIVNSIYKLES